MAKPEEQSIYNSVPYAGILKIDATRPQVYPAPRKHPRSERPSPLSQLRLEQDQRNQHGHDCGSGPQEVDGQ